MDLLYLQALNSQLQALIQQRRREIEIIEISEITVEESVLVQQLVFSVSESTGRDV